MQPEFQAFFLALASAAVYGAGDFTGGMVTRRASVYGVVIISQLAGMLGYIVLAFLAAEKVPTGANLLNAAAGGILGGIGLAALYLSLSRGRMGMTAPISAVLSAAFPVLVAAVVSGLPNNWQVLGFAVAGASIWLVAYLPGERLIWSDLQLPVIAGIGFGFFYIFLDYAGEDAVFFPLVIARFASLIILSLAAWYMQQSIRVPRQYLPMTLLTGAMDATANALYIIAARLGRLDIVAVLVSLYPASTVLLAWLITNEKIYRTQVIGLGLALVAVVLIAI